MTQAALERFARELPAGEVLFREGDGGRVMYVLRSGRVRLTTNVRDHELELAVVGPGEFFGEMALLNGHARSATATVLEAALLLEIDARTFESMLKANTEIAVRMVQRLASRLALADQHIQTLLLKDHPSRVASFLLGELRVRGIPHGRIQVEVAHVIGQTGCTEAEVAEALATLARLGLVLASEGGGWAIPDAEALAFFIEMPAATPAARR